MDSERLFFKKISDADEDQMIEMMSSSEIMRFIERSDPSLHTAKKRFEKILSTNSQFTNYGFYVALHKLTNKVIGYIKFVPINESDIELGYAFLPANWGKGYATEVTKIMIDHIKRLRSFKFITAFVNPQNTASVKVLEKCGFKEKAILDDQSFKTISYQIQL